MLDVRFETCLRIELYPSIDEIEAAELDLYAGALGGFHDSVNEFLDAIKKYDWGPRDGEKSSREESVVANAAPPMFVQTTIGIAFSGFATAVYHLMKQWAATKNGRKIKVRFGEKGDWQIEATQLTIAQFLELVRGLDIAMGKAHDKDSWTNHAGAEKYFEQVESMRKSLERSGVSTIDSFSEEARREKGEIIRAASHRLSEARGGKGKRKSTISPGPSESEGGDAAKSTTSP
jgi:hypothetical protein